MALLLQGLTGIDFDAFIAYKRTHFEASLSQVRAGILRVRHNK